MSGIISYCHIKQNEIWRDGNLKLTLKDFSLDDFLSQAYQQLAINYPKFFKMDRLSKLGLLASEVLLQNVSRELTPESTAVILTNSHSSLDTDQRYWESTQQVASPSLFVYTLPNIVAGEICIRNGFKGESNFFVSETFEPRWLASNVDLALSRVGVVSCLAGWVNVSGNQAEVFLYLAHISTSGVDGHSAGTIERLFKSWSN